MLSVCMIVKDEIKFIKDCLEKVSPYADEIVVVDTGSTDGTLEILQNFKCNVHHFDWCDDYSKARNFSISKATNDWILILDADEHIIEFDIDSINKYINNKKNNEIVGQIVVKSFVGEQLSNFKIDLVPRLFNRNFYEYTTPIHEKLTPKFVFETKANKVAIEVQHYGYTKAIVEEKNKEEKYSKIIMDYTKDNFDPYLIKQLATNLHNLGKYEESINTNNQIIDNPEVQKQFYFPEIVGLKLASLLQLKRYDEAFELQKYYELCKDNDSFLLNMAHVFKVKNHGETAVDIYQYLISKPELSISRLKPVYALAETLFEYELYEEAMSWYEQIKVNNEIIQKIEICKQKLGIN